MSTDQQNPMEAMADKACRQCTRIMNRCCTNGVCHWWCVDCRIRVDVDSEKKIIVSFSGGRTSAYMAKRIKDAFPHAKFIFANTGQENNETLDFVNACDKAWGLGVIWVEAVFNLTHGEGVTHKVVTYETATRITDPFEGTPFDMLMQKNGIVTIAAPKCTDRLKGMPITHWKKVNGYAKAKHAIGIRIDEQERCFIKAGKNKGQRKPFWYPLCDNWPTTKEEVNAFWETQPFRLSLCEHFGNCAWCFKKSLKKLRMVAMERPESFAFPEFVEAKYGKDKPMFRGKMTSHDIKNPRQVQLKLLNSEVESSACVESCEPF